MINTKKNCSKERACKILIIDDNKIDNLVLQQILDCKNISITICDDGRKAWNLINTISVPDLIFLELLIPGIKGFQLLEHIRSKKAWNKVPVIVISELGDADSVKNTIRHGVNAYIHKPYNAVRLRSEVDNFLNA